MATASSSQRSERSSQSLTRFKNLLSEVQAPVQRFLENSKLIRHYLWKYRKWVGVGLVALIIVDVLDIFPPLYLKAAVDGVIERKPLRFLGMIAIAYLTTCLCQGFCRYLWRMFLIRASIYAGRDIRSRFTGHLFSLSVGFFDKTPLGTLMSLATNDVEAVRIAMGTGLLVFADAVFYLATIPVAMFILSPKLTLISCLPLPFIPFIVLRNEKKVHERFEAVQDCFGKISSLTQENLNGIRVVKAFACEEIQIQRLRELGEKYMALNLRLAKIQTTVGPLMDLFMSFGMVLLLVFGGREVIFTDGAAISLGTFVAFQKYIQKMVWPMAALGMAVNYYQRSVTSSKRLLEILSTKTDVPEPSVSHEVKESANSSIPVGARSSDPTGRIEFKNLGFQYPTSRHPVLRQIEFTIEPGERVAITGGIGSGKSTLLSLLPRLYAVERGMLWIDGVDVNDWSLGALRKQMGYVSQDVFLFSDTVMENVAFGLNEGFMLGGSQEIIEKAAELSSVDQDIGRFASAYRTRLGERGVGLSGGQKQRLTLARALVKEPSILILDDALSSVDVQTEEKILSGLKTRPGRNTEIIVAHRISTLKDADRIIVLENGSISEMGTHTQLLKQKKSQYSRFYQQQQLMDELENYQHGLV